MIITTTDSIPQYITTAHHAVLFTEQVCTISMVKDLFHGLKGAFGGKNEAYAQEYRKLRAQAMEDIEKQTIEYGANAIIHLRLHIDQFVNSDLVFLIVTASGDAVTVEKQ